MNKKRRYLRLSRNESDQFLSYDQIINKKIEEVDGRVDREIKALDNE